MDTSGSLLEAGFDAVQTGVAILDADGEIVYANEAWREHGAAPSLVGESWLVGTNYLDRESDDELVSRVLDGLAEVLAGDRDAVTVTGALEAAGGLYVRIRADGFTEGDARYALVQYADAGDDALARYAERDAQLATVASVISHDLRNPLNVALGRLELLAEDVDSPHYPPIENSLRRLGDIIDDSLFLARHAIVEETEPVDLQSVTEAAWRGTVTENASLTVEDSTTLRADPSLLQRVLEELLSNAAEHGGDDVAVTVGVLDDDTGFYVEDDGPGIAEKNREDVFEHGYTTTRQAGSTGMGLTIVEQICRSHGWTIELVESAAGGVRAEISGVTPA